MAKKNTIKVLMMAAECAPFAKVGGLGDVVGTLPLALHKLDVDVRVVMPLYGSIEKRKYNLKKIYSDLEIPSGQILIKVNIYEANFPGSSVKIYFIDAPDYFKYEDVYIKGDNSERFLFFSLAALYATPIMRLKPDIVHCHDSHTGLVPDILKTTNLGYLKDIKTLFTIHNLNYQSKARPSVLSTGNLHPKSTKSLSRDARDGDVNFMIQGILMADIINTVSEKYAKEITTETYGASLEMIIKQRKKDLYGIVNGIDINYFNSVKDRYIQAHFSEKSLDKKLDNKKHLLKKLNLPYLKDVPLIGMISRLFWQKGFEFITPRLAKLPAQFVFLGTGEEKYEKHLKNLAKKYPTQISAQIKFSEKLAHEIYAGSDIFLIPSRYEPCGLGQMIAMRYGTIPVVRATGGLDDTVDGQVGFKFKELSSTAIYYTLKRAIDIYEKNHKKWREMQITGMKKDFSWEKSAKKYLDLYKKLLKK